MNGADAGWAWGDAALEWLDALGDAGGPAVVVRTLELAAGVPRGRRMAPDLAQAAHLAAELVAAQRGAPALSLPRTAWRWLDEHGEFLGGSAVGHARRAVRRLADDDDASRPGAGDDDAGALSAALLNLERRLQAASWRVTAGAGDEAETAGVAAGDAPMVKSVAASAASEAPTVKQPAQLAFVWPDDGPAVDAEIGVQPVRQRSAVGRRRAHGGGRNSGSEVQLRLLGDE